MIHGQDDEAARKWEEFQNQPTGGEPPQKGRCAVRLGPSERRGVERDLIRGQIPAHRAEVLFQLLLIASPNDER
jgi:hypothetical protein